MSSTALPIGPSAISVKVHPLVLLNICDAYIRRNENQVRVIGTLLGTAVDNVVEVKNCYAVPHNENSDQVALDINHHRTLYDLHHKVNPKEQIVGWYSTGLGVSGSDALIQDFYGRDCTNPVHLTLDTSMINQTITIAAYVSRPLLLNDKQLGVQFQEIDCEVRTVELEKLGVDVMQKVETDKLPKEMDSLEVTFRRLLTLLEQTYDYVDGVVEGKTPADPVIGRYIADSVAAVPYISPADFETLLTEGAQDDLLILYFSKLVKSHLALADRLGTAALPLL
eukprot:jgi/Botrbrau1/16963/Bobra.49_2s0025.1